MKFVFISDTHGLHQDFPKLPKGDVLIHGGDFCSRGWRDDTVAFLQWFEAQHYSHKIFIAGNHDLFAEKYRKEFEAMIPDGITYLNDSGTQIGKIKIWGSPVQPDLVMWAFGKRRGKEIKKHWDLIPDNTDILLTHTPPYRILDKSSSGTSQGCEELRKKVEMIRPRVHLFGHIHASYGRRKKNGIIFINGSSIKTGVGIVNKPKVFELG